MLAALAGVLFADAKTRMHPIFEPLRVDIYVSLGSVVHSASTSAWTTACDSRNMTGVWRSSVAYLRAAICTTRLWAAIGIIGHLLRVTSVDCRADTTILRHHRSSNVGSRGSIVLVEVKVLGLLFIEVLARVRSLVLQELDESVKPNGEKCAQQRAQPVNPVVSGKRMQHDARSERSGRIEGAYISTRVSKSQLCSGPPSVASPNTHHR